MEDAYWDRGLGYFVMAHGGLEFEVSGRSGRISWESYFPRVSHPTRIRVGDIWVRTLVRRRRKDTSLEVHTRYGIYGTYWNIFIYLYVCLVCMCKVVIFPQCPI